MFVQLFSGFDTFHVKCSTCFSKTATPNCSSFVYYSWKSLFLHNILKCAGGKTSSLKINAPMAENHYPSILRKKSINMLTSRGCFLKENTCIEASLILSIEKFLRQLILKKICKRLLLKMCS